MRPARFNESGPGSISAIYPDVHSQSRWILAPSRRLMLQCPVRTVTVPLAGNQHPVEGTVVH
jgi:hypothetical protein